MTVRCQTAEAGADVGAHVVLAMAARAGVPPVAADRLRGDIRDALHAAGGVVELTCSADDEEVRLAIRAPEGRADAIAAALDGHAAEVDGTVVHLRIRRTPLRAV